MSINNNNYYVFINKEDLAFESITGYTELLSYAEERKKEGEDNFLFIDEIQDIEIDFVADRGEKRIYVQVAFSIPDQKVKEREFGNLLAIKDNYRKLVVSLDEIQVSSYEGVEHMHIRKFLRESL